LTVRRTLALLTVLAVGLTLVAPSSAISPRRHVETLIIAIVGPGDVLSVQWLSEKTIKRLKPGRYYILVQDRSNVRNFHLRGPGINRASPVQRVHAFAWHVVLRKGVYKFWSDPQKRTMHGQFRVA
jgi:hypothetical protein